MPEREWVPALSDIDLTIVIDDALRLDEEYAFLHSFWKAHKRLKRLFPMLGEIEIFNVSELRSFVSLGSWGTSPTRGKESTVKKLGILKMFYRI